MGRVYFRSVLLLYETRHKIDDAFRDNINGRLKHQLYRKLGSLNTRHEIYFQRENRCVQRDRERYIDIEKLNMILMIVGGETIRLNRALNVE